MADSGSLRLSMMIGALALVATACSTAVGATIPGAEPLTIDTIGLPPPTSGVVTTTLAEPAPRVLTLPKLEVWAFPGPNHYAGDVLTFQVPVGGFGDNEIVEATISVDGQPLETRAVMAGDPLLGDVIVFRDAFDTDGAVGGHWVEVNATLAPDRRIEAIQRVVVTPDVGRPAQESATSWQIERIDCCNIEYLANSAAARDLDALVEIVDSAAVDVEAHFGLELPTVNFVLIDTLWGNGGYAGDEVVVSYLDRDYSPGRESTFRQTVLHELAHAVTAQLEHSTPWPLIEGVAVQFTQGHFKPEPLGARAKALSESGELPDLAVIFDTFPDMQHETRYAAVGAFTEYLVSTFGFDRLMDLFSAEPSATGVGSWLDAAAKLTLDVDIDELQTGFDEWVDSFEASSQVQDLELTIALQEARRSFQATYDPYPNYFVYRSVTATGQDSLAMRDPRSTRLVAVEALIAYAQDLIIEGDLGTAADVVAEVERIVAEGTVGPGLSGDFLGVAEAAHDAGFELIQYRPGSEPTTIVATSNAPDLSLLEVEHQAGEWKVVSSRPAPASVGALGQ